MTRDGELSDASPKGGMSNAVEEPTPKKGTLGGGCDPLSELDPEFGGFSLEDLSIDEGTPACTTGTCVIQGFQGRVSCPYGQLNEGSCLLPGSSEPVVAAVPPQLVARPPRLGAVCSCHCAGPGPGPYCACPSHLKCTHLIDDFGFGARELAGSYCLPKDAQYVRESVDVTSACERELQNCEP